MNKLAIAIPTYNEKDNLNALVSEIEKVLRNVNVKTAVLIIDDNSPDGTGVIADNLAKHYKGDKFNVRVLHRKEKLGLSSAYLDAFEKLLPLGFDYIMTMDADFSHNPRYIPEMLEIIEKNDLVIGSRYVKGGGVENWNLLRRFISKGGSLYSRIILGVNIKDFTAGFNLYRRGVLEGIDLKAIKSEGYAYQIEMKYHIAKKGFKIYEFPIIFPDRKFGKAKMSKRIVLEALLRVWQIRFTKV